MKLLPSLFSFVYSRVKLFAMNSRRPYSNFVCFIYGLKEKTRGGYSQKNWVGVCGPLPKNPTLFMTKICDIPYPIYDLAKNSKPYLWPVSVVRYNGSPVQTNVKLL